MTAPSSRAQTAKIVTAGSIALIAASSAVVMLLFLARFGTATAADGALAAYSAYVLTTVFAQGCRITGAAAVGGANPRVQPAELAWTLGLTGTALAVLFVVAAAPLADALTATDSAAGAARDTLPVLGLGVASQFYAVAWAVLLGLQGRVTSASVSLAIGGVASLVAFVLLAPRVGVAALGWSTLFSGGIACLVMATRTGVRVAAVQWRRIRATGGLLLRENLVPLFSTTVYAEAVVIAGSLPGDGPSQDPGGTAAFALAFLVSSYICGILGTSVAIVDTIELSSDVDGVGARLQRTLPAALRVVYPAGAAVMAVGAIAAPIALGLLGSSSTTEDGALVGVLLLGLAPFTFATLATNVAFSCWFSAARVGALNRGLWFAMPLSLVAIGGGFLAFDLYGAAIGINVTTLAFAWWALRPAPSVMAFAVRRAGALLAVLAAVGIAGAGAGVLS